MTVPSAGPLSRGKSLAAMSAPTAVGNDRAGDPMVGFEAEPRTILNELDRGVMS